MRHSRYTQLLQLSIYDELSDKESSALQSHLRECDQCRAELDHLKRLSVVMNRRVQGVEVDDRLLNEARTQLLSALAAEQSRRSLWSRVRGGFEFPRMGILRPSLAGAFLLAGGFLLGRFAFPSSFEERQTNSGVSLPPTAVSNPDAQPQTTQITNVRFIDAANDDGSVEFTFDAVTRVHMRGNINDERVQNVLAHALVNDQNPGVRLRSVSAIASRAPGNMAEEKNVKEALITALTSDRNPGVRREALRALRRMPFDDATRHAYLHVLAHDTNPGMRVAAINGLDSAQVNGWQPGAEALSVLRERMQSDENNYVRLRAKAVLEEARIQ